MSRERKKRLAALALLLPLSAVFLMPFAWMVTTSLKHESRIFAQSGESISWMPYTDVRDEQGRPVVHYAGRKGVLLGTAVTGCP